MYRLGRDLKGKDLGKGISQRRDGRYQARFTNRFGERPTVYGNTLKEVKNLLHQAIIADIREENVKDSKLTLDEWSEKWLRIYKKPTIKEVTYAKYQNLYRTMVKPYLGKYKLTSITNLMVADYLSQLSDEYSTGTLKFIRGILSNIFKYAVKNNLCSINPTEGIALKKNSKKIVVLKMQDQLDFLEYSKDDYYCNAYKVLLNTGMRIGELAALTIEDIDLKNNVINVNKTMAYYQKKSCKYNFHVTTPKTKASIRQIPINAICLDAIKNQIERNKNLPDTQIKNYNNLLFPTKSNAPLSQPSFSYHIKKIIKAINAEREKKDMELLPNFNSHTFRHTFATRCFEVGIQPKTVQDYLGHSSIQMTLDIYTEVLIEKKFEDIKKLECIDGKKDSSIHAT